MSCPSSRGRPGHEEGTDDNAGNVVVVVDPPRVLGSVSARLRRLSPVVRLGSDDVFARSVDRLVAEASRPILIHVLGRHPMPASMPRASADHRHGLRGTMPATSLGTVVRRANPTIYDFFQKL